MVVLSQINSFFQKIRKPIVIGSFFIFFILIQCISARPCLSYVPVDLDFASKVAEETEEVNMETLNLKKWKKQGIEKNQREEKKTIKKQRKIEKIKRWKKEKKIKKFDAPSFNF